MERRRLVQLAPSDESEELKKFMKETGTTVVWETDFGKLGFAESVQYLQFMTSEDMAMYCLMFDQSHKPTTYQTSLQIVDRTE